MEQIKELLKAKDIGRVKSSLQHINPSYKECLLLNKLLREHMGMFSEETKIKVAAVGSYTLNNLQEPLWLSLVKKGFQPEIIIGKYNQYMQEILDANSRIRKSDPDILLVLLDTETFLEGVLSSLLGKSLQEMLDAVEMKIGHLKAMLAEVKRSMKAHIILSNLVIPYYSPLGMRDAGAEEGVRALVAGINRRISGIAGEFGNITLFDVENFASYWGKKHLTADRYWYLGRLYISNDLSMRFCGEIAVIIASYYGKAKKCLVVDLDNTLWGGVIGEDFVEGIRLGEGDPIGEAHAEIQRVILNLHENGIILAINSKNNTEDAETAFTHKGMLLKKDHFACIKCNWNDKAVNMIEIAKELNIGLDSTAYLDDNPAERESMKHKLPQVYVIDFPEDVAEVPRILKTLGIFDLLKVSNEDLKRTKMYLEEKKREVLKGSFADLTDYLYDLCMEVEISPLNERNIERITQLINKTNQFNLRTRRYTQEQVQAMADDGKHRIYAASLKDKFGEFGSIGVLVVEDKGEHWFIDTFLLSCRAMSRGVEKEFLRQTLARLDGPSLVCGEYLKTPKNAPVEHLYPDIGFKEKNGKWWFDKSKKRLEKVKWLKVKFNG